MNRNTLLLARITILSLLGMVIVGYSLFQTHKLITGPIIDVYTPQNGAVYNSTLIEIDGRAQNISYINLNDRKIFTDTKGYFSEKLLLSPGYTIIKLDAQDKFGKSTQKIIQVILKEY